MSIPIRSSKASFCVSGSFCCTFCSHLAMKGATAISIQELAGHAHLSTTMRYMHLQAGHKEAAIRLLESTGPTGAPWHCHIVATPIPEVENPLANQGVRWSGKRDLNCNGE